MHEQDSDFLARWVGSGDQQAFMELVARYQGMVYWVCYRILGDVARAEDLMQECFMKLTGHQPKEGVLLGPWFHTVATNAALSQLRSDGRRLKREQAYAREQKLVQDAVEWDDVSDLLVV